MHKLVTVLSVLIITAFVAGCGGGSSNSAANTVIYEAPASLADPNIPALMGGAVAKGSVIEAKFSNYSVSTFAGSVGKAGFTNNSTATLPTTAKFNHPVGITTDGTDFYVADYNNNAIRKIDQSGVVTTFAGSVAGIAGLVDGIGTTAIFNHPTDITTDGINLYVVDSANNVIRIIDKTTKNVTTIGSTIGLAGAVDVKAVPPAVTADVTLARFNNPTGITTDGINLYVTDTGSHTIRMINILTKAVTTLAGAPGVAGAVGGTQSAARFNLPARITTDRVKLYVTDYNNRTIRQIDLLTGDVTTLAGIAGIFGFADTAAGVTATFYHPNGITTDGTNLYVTDYNDTSLPNPQYWNTVRKINIATKTVTTIAGGISIITPNSLDGIGTNARFDAPVGITTDGSSLYVADSINNTIRKIE